MNHLVVELFILVYGVLDSTPEKCSAVQEVMHLFELFVIQKLCTFCLEQP